MNIYVGNVPYAATEEDLETLFSEYGPVATATIIRDRYDGRSKGFGFVEMENQEDGERAIEALDGQDFMGRPLKVNPARPREERRQPRRPEPPTNQTQDPHEQHESSPNGHFHNPYTFVPTPPRDRITAGEFAGDFNPLENGLDHASLKDNLWTGHIPIKLTTVTPLVLLKDDGRERKTTKYQTYDVHSRIPESSLRGMLRSAYEVVTNSRFGCFRNDEQLAYRMDTREAVKLIPAIIEEDSTTGELKACLYTGTTHPDPDGPKKPRPNQNISAARAKKCAVYAAMLTCYGNKTPKTELQGSYKDPKTGDKIYAEIILCDKSRYLYWKASRVWRKEDCSTIPPVGNVPQTWKDVRLYKDGNGNPIIKVIEGTVLITNNNIDRKHDERIFFNPLKNPCDVTAKHIQVWKKLIKNYRDAHTDDEIFNREDRDGKSKKPWHWFQKNRDTTEWAWSPHLYHKGKSKDRWGREVHDAINLQNGTMVYARCEFNGSSISGIKDLFPVTISRELYENTPKDLLDESLHPAAELDQLSPADRLFGWTPQEQGNDSGYKSRIRVVCEDGERPEILESFNDPLPLTILGQPKPEQGRFYVAADEAGTPQKGKSKQEAGYNKDGKKHLRGRKHYWHHKRLEAENDADYWNPSGKDRIREYIYSGDKPSQQNRSIKGWIKPQKQFKASLYVQNLQQEEVGALLWLLTRPKNHFFRLGYGKPLGFGSVKIGIDTRVNECLPLGTGKHWKKYYAELNGILPAHLDGNQQNEFIDQFERKMVAAYNAALSFDQLPFVSAFLQVLQGPNGDAPKIHYPRLTEKPDSEGKNYAWFMANERGRSRREAGRDEVGKKLALPDVNDENDKGLPYIPSKPRN